MTISAQNTLTISVGATDFLHLDYQDELENGETLSGTPTVVSSGVGLSVSSPQVGTTSFRDKLLDRVAPASKHVRWQAVGNTAGTYTVLVTATTSASRTLPFSVTVTVE